MLKYRKYRKCAYMSADITKVIIYKYLLVTESSIGHRIVPGVNLAVGMGVGDTM